MIPELEKQLTNENLRRLDVVDQLHKQVDRCSLLKIENDELREQLISVLSRYELQMQYTQQIQLSHST